MSESAPDSAARDSLALLQSLEAFSAHLAAVSSVDQLIDASLEGLARFMGHRTATLFLACDGSERLHVVASSGYESSGAGSSVLFDQAVLRALQGSPNSMDVFIAAGEALAPSGSDRRIVRPKLENAGSRLSVPFWDREELLGALLIEREEPDRFSAADEAALNIVCRQIGLTLSLVLARGPSFPAVMASSMSTPQLISGRINVFTHYAEDDSILIAGEFVINGTAGAILWRLLAGHIEAKATESRPGALSELPPLPANTEMLLVLISRRLRDCLDFVRLTPLAAGSFLLEVDREITLLEIPK